MNVNFSNSRFGATRCGLSEVEQSLNRRNALGKRARVMGVTLAAIVLGITVLRQGFLGLSSVAADSKVKEEPSEAPSTPRGARKAAAATKESPWQNSLGMRFVPVPICTAPADGGRVLFSVWDTRVQDYDVFAKQTTHTVEMPSFDQGPTHPVVKVSWDDAKAFCEWLTERERKSGKLGAGERYRLPTDHEWSCAVGIGEREDAKAPPGDKDGKINGESPWGKAWPPPKGSGNYRGEEYAISEPEVPRLHGYNDGMPHTSPVGSFFANHYGLYDIGGNVWQWCEDLYDNHWTARVIRGASWYSYEKESLLSSFRFNSAPDARSDNIGFRCVLVSRH